MEVLGFHEIPACRTPERRNLAREVLSAYSAKSSAKKRLKKDDDAQGVQAVREAKRNLSQKRKALCANDTLAKSRCLKEGARS
jgi:hypothetical protein